MRRAQVAPGSTNDAETTWSDRPVGEFSMPHGPTYGRERTLWADVIAYEDDEIH